MEVKPFFSVVVPTYNRSHRLAIALRSLQAQQFQNFEVIVVDDGSTDDTKSMVLDLSEKDERIIYLYKENEERSIARNYGIQQARGSYVSFLDSDDIVYPNHLAEAHQLIEENQFPEVCHLGYERITEQGVILFQQNKLDETLPDKMIFENHMHGNAVFIKLQVAREYPFIQHRSATLGEDWYVWLRLAARFKIHINNIVTSAVIEHEARSLNNIDVDEYGECVELIVQHLKRDPVFLSRYQRHASYFFSRQYSLAMLLASLNKRTNSCLHFMSKAIYEDAGVCVSRRFLASLKYFVFPFLIKSKV